MGLSPAGDMRTEPQPPNHADNDDRLPATPLSLGNRVARTSPRLLVSAHGQSAAQASAGLATLMTATPNAMSLGPSSPPLAQLHADDFVPPLRPSSTPFPQPDQRADTVRCLGYPDASDVDDQDADAIDHIHHHMDDGDHKAMTTRIIQEVAFPMADDMMDLDMDAADKGDQPDDLDSAFLSGVGASNLAATSLISVGMAAHGDSSMPITTPPLSPISTIATSLDSPDSRFDAFVEYPLDGLDKKAAPEALTVPSSPALPSSPTLPPSATELATPLHKKKQQTLFLQHLPMEIQALILDHLFDGRISPLATRWPDKRLTKLAVFSHVWRALIQERLYCRIKLKATVTTLNDALIHFAQNSHLRSYVKHVELWFPVFEPRMVAVPQQQQQQPFATTVEGIPSTSYVLPSDNCSLEEAFYFLSTTFPELGILTLEGGERRKAPQVRHFLRDALGGGGAADAMALDTAEEGPSVLCQPVPAIPPIATVRTLVCKGQWNLIRSDRDFQNIAAALPNMHEWLASYSKPKSKSYLTMATILPNLPVNLTSLDLCLEGDYRQEISFPPYFLKVTDKVHFCGSLAEATPALQHLSYTGRVCRTFFEVAARIADPRTTRLKSVELTVKNCCRQVNHWHESGSGVTDLNFIRAFEALVLSAVRSLARLTKLEHLRIRYVDLEFPVPPLNPFFVLHDGWASGVWSDTIVSELSRVRPDVQWEELSESIGERTLSKDGRLIINAEFPKKRVVSLKLSNYAFLVALVTM